MYSVFQVIPGVHTTPKWPKLLLLPVLLHSLLLAPICSNTQWLASTSSAHCAVGKPPSQT
jgi:hypothetical protein